MPIIKETYIDCPVCKGDSYVESRQCKNCKGIGAVLEKREKVIGEKSIPLPKNVSIDSLIRKDI